MGRFLASLSIVVTYAVLSLGKPANDWSKPCFHGECAYDMPEHTGHSGALKIVSLDIYQRNELLTQVPL